MVFQSSGVDEPTGHVETIDALALGRHVQEGPTGAFSKSTICEGTACDVRAS